MNSEEEAIFALLNKSQLDPEVALELRTRISKISTQSAHSEFKYNRTLKEKNALHNLTRRISQDLNQKMEELGEARKEADKANEAKSKFLASMSHEIRTPMNGVLGMIQLLQQTPLNVEQAAYVSTIHSSGEVLLEIINQILDLSKIEAGKMQVVENLFSLRGAFNSTIDLFRPLAKEKGLLLEFSLPHSLPDTFIGDASKIRQVLTNLIGNAIKFTDSGKVLVEIEVQASSSAESLLQCKVTDTGSGISPEELSLIFKPFIQTDNTVRNEQGGTGLGLTISHKLTSLMGGDMWAASELQKGSVFGFFIPLKREEENVFQSKMEVVKPAHTAKLDRQLGTKLPLNILLVEDNRINQMLATSVLKKMGYVPMLAENGLEAVRLIQENTFDLVLMDIQMPIMNGLEATRKIRSCPNSHQPIIIAMTANASESDRSNCLEAGMNDFLSKPFTLEHFQSLVVKWGTKT